MKQLLIFFTLIGMLVSAEMSAQTEITYEGSEEYGRMYDIIYHPTIENRLYAVTLGSHIMQSNDKGETWEVLYSFSENGVHLNNLKLLPDNTLSFSAQYSATLTKNAVYLYDIDQDEIINQYTPPITSDSDKVWINSYAVHENDPDVALVHQAYKIGFSGYAKVYYTADGGDTWEMVYYTENNNGIFPNNVAISPNDPEKLFIARGASPNTEEGGLLISENAGTTWEEKIPGNNYKVITFKPDDADTILVGTFIGDENNGHEENLYRSTDGGDTWNIIPITWEEGVLDNITAIAYNPLDMDNIILLEENEVVITHDDWDTWEKTVYPLDNLEGYYYGINLSFSPFENGELFVNADYHPIKSDDGGETFSRVYNPFYFTIMAAYHSGTDDHLYHGVQRGLVHENLSTGTVNAYDVQPLNLVFGFDAPVYFVDKLTTGRVYKYKSTFTGASLNVSDNHGESYTFLYSNFNDQLISLTTDPTNPNIIWVSFLNQGGRIIDFTDPNNPEVTTINLPEANILTDVYIDETNSDTVYITVGAHVYRSEDGGDTWEEKSNGLNINPSTDIIFDIEKSPFHKGEFNLTASNGIYTTRDNAENWTKAYDGNNIRKVDYSTVNDQHAVASIHSNNGIQSKMVYTKDNGETWEDVPFEEFAHAGSASMAYKFHEESVDAYIATFDLGLIKYTIDLTELGTPALEESSNPFVVYPNPATNTINIKENGGTVTSVAIYNNLGQQVMKPSSEKQINITQLDSGVYFVKIKNVEGNYFVKRVLKK